MVEQRLRPDPEPTLTGRVDTSDAAMFQHETQLSCGISYLATRAGSAVPMSPLAADFSVSIALYRIRHRSDQEGWRYDCEHRPAGGLERGGRACRRSVSRRDHDSSDPQPVRVERAPRGNPRRA